MPKRLLRFFCAALTFALLAAGLPPMAATGRAEAGIGAYVFTYTLAVYEKPSKKSEVLAQEPFAKPIRRVAEKNGWAQVVTQEGVEGYCNAKQLTDKNPNVYEKTVYSQQKQAPVYQRPSVDAPLIGHLNRNEKSVMVAMTPKGDWLRVRSGDRYGYIQRPRVDFSRYAKGRAVWIGVGAADIYYDSKLDSVIGSVPFGQALAWLGTENGRAKIRSGSGLIGYCDPACLTDANPVSGN